MKSKSDSERKTQQAKQRLLTVLSVAFCVLSFELTAAERVDVAQLSPETEAAINKGLKWLLDQQRPDGSIGERFPVASTSLALMAFMVQGSFPEKPPFGDPLKRALNYLLSPRRTSGFLGSSMYEHGLATLALSEAWGMSSRKDEIRETLKKAVHVIVKAQNPEGGWRYQPDGKDADVSATVMQAVALASAQEAGIAVPEETIQNAIKYVKSCAVKNGGFMYQAKPGQGAGFARTAAGVLSLYMCGQRDCPEAQQGLNYLLSQNVKKFEQAEHYFYAHYYSMQVMYQAGDEHYQSWYPKIRDALLARQDSDGSFLAGGRGESHAPAADTAFAILILGVPYRFLPIYQR